jgi:D-arabinose 1-dehydrogenase-like Zn-dependent alcohol dehydrogenase
MSTIERCVHQISDEGKHVLFQEQWEKCKKCTYDQENNKKCCGYSPITYYGAEFENPNLIASTSQNIRGIKVA